MKNIFIMLCFFISFVSCSNTNIANTNNTNVIMSTNDDGSIVFEQKDIVYNIDYIPNVVYANKDNTDLTLQIMIPRTLNVDTNAKYPLVVYIQGSAWRKQNVYRNLVALGDFARRGYVVAIVEYRPSDTAIFPAQIEDTRDAIKFMLDNSDKYNADAYQQIHVRQDLQNHLTSYANEDSRCHQCATGNLPLQFPPLSLVQPMQQQHRHQTMDMFDGLYSQP